MKKKLKNEDLESKLFDEISEFLRQLNWPMEAISNKAIRTFYLGYFGKSEVMIHIGHKDVCMVIDPVIDRPKETWGEAVISLIMAMGEEIRHMGLGLDADGDLFIKVHLPSEHVNLERFQFLIKGLCQVAENIVVPILQANAFDNLKAHP